MGLDTAATRVYLLTPSRKALAIDQADRPGSQQKPGKGRRSCRLTYWALRKNVPTCRNTTARRNRWPQRVGAAIGGKAWILLNAGRILRQRYDLPKAPVAHSSRG